MQNAAPLVTLTARKRRTSPMRRQEALMAALLILPSTLGILAFAVLPIAASLGISLTDWGGLSKPNFVGLQNYGAALHDPRATSALSHTLIYVLLAVPTGVLISLTLAVWINNLKAGWLRTVFRTVYYLPMVTIGVAVALLWQVLLAPQGLVNLILGWLGIHGPNWLGSPAWVLPAVAVFSVWQGSGQGIILFLASLASVPRDLYEAAQLDGARPFEAFRYITLPMISPTVFLVLVLSLIGALQVFEAVLVLSNGGPGDSSTTVALYIYKTAFTFFKMGYASALAWLLAVILIGLMVLQWRNQSKWVNYDQV
ncbi:carbohydrate ABC transporter permease [Deinococcus humi]|uniref:Multiple sugar transport system permease protein n=1 Tax=Deinococcus humi TaxID=662880 RepID=A0A7W8K0F0_9DEIO|nr:sugar ABC transporter permease [Deinococcus humi]MBB5366203.1 multiple sugar transport system permease protein [Deinococcus humi]GGO40845.1 sugar ABC transporter permease [Deinococcus humi]